MATKTLKRPAKSIKAPIVGSSYSGLFKTWLVAFTRMNTPKMPIAPEIYMPRKPIFRNIFRTITPMMAKNIPVISPRGAEN